MGIVVGFPNLLVPVFMIAILAGLLIIELALMFATGGPDFDSYWDEVNYIEHISMMLLLSPLVHVALAMGAVGFAIAVTAIFIAMVVFFGFYSLSGNNK